MTVHTPLCLECNAICIRDEHHDAYFCRTCDQWHEQVCPDADCQFCAERPEKPSQVKIREEVR